jgi:glucose 1-dehydrogenase
MKVDLTGRVALITGGSRGIGRGCARVMAGAGADIVINYFSHGDDAESVAQEVREAGREALVVRGDVADRADVDKMVDAAVERFGRLDIAVCNSYYSKRQPFLDIEIPEMQRTMDVTFWGSFHTAQAAARQMVKQGNGGSLVFITSLYAVIPHAGSLPYNSAKAGVNHMAETIANEMAVHRIRANSIQPGWTDTPGERQYFTEEQMREAGKEIPWGRLATIDEIAQAATFLASDAAEYVTGASLRIDGGFSYVHR